MAESVEFLKEEIRHNSLCRDHSLMVAKELNDGTLRDYFLKQAAKFEHRVEALEKRLGASNGKKNDRARNSVRRNDDGASGGTVRTRKRRARKRSG